MDRCFDQRPWHCLNFKPLFLQAEAELIELPVAYA